MTVSFQLNQEDFLRYQLYAASQSEKLKKFRFRKRITFPLLFLFFGTLFLFVKLPQNLTFVCFGVALVWFIVYPIWDKNRYKMRFKKFVDKNYAERFGKQVSIEIDGANIIGNDNGFEVIVKPKELEEIVVLPKLILIKIDEARVMLVATEKLENSDAFENELSQFARIWDISFKVQKHWKF